MTKSDLILKIVQKYSFLYQKDVHKIVNIIFGTVSEAIGNGDRVELRGFGAFSSKKERLGLEGIQKLESQLPSPQKTCPFLRWVRL